MSLSTDASKGREPATDAVQHLVALRQGALQLVMLSALLASPQRGDEARLCVYAHIAPAACICVSNCHPPCQIASDTSPAERTANPALERHAQAG